MSYCKPSTTDPLWLYSLICVQYQQSDFVLATSVICYRKNDFLCLKTQISCTVYKRWVCLLGWAENNRTSLTIYIWIAEHLFYGWDIFCFSLHYSGAVAKTKQIYIRYDKLLLKHHKHLKVKFCNITNVCSVTRIHHTFLSVCASSDFFQHFGNSTSTSSIGKNSLIIPSIGKIGDIYLRNGKNIMISVTVICFLKINNI